MIGALVTPTGYRAAGVLAAPLVRAWLLSRLRAGKEDHARFGERLGRASLPRPEGRLVWMHGASVGEGLSLEPLIARLGAVRPALQVLVTTGTVTSARLLGTRLPAYAPHQFAPIDRRPAVRRFLGHWRPDLALWVESELWPNMILETAARGVPMLLLNGRMSARSAARWRRLPRLAGPVLASFRHVLAQTETDAARFRALGAERVSVRGNLKNDAPPLDADEGAVADLRRRIGGRACWIAASTHAGEEEAVAEAHLRLRETFPYLLTVLAPRHPERAGQIARLLAERGLAVARRSENAPIEPATAVYLADTLGELGLVYRIAEIAFVGGSLAPHGGHNPLEPARLGCAVLAGPSMENFSEARDALRRADALGETSSAADIASRVGALLGDETARRRMQDAAAAAARSLAGATAETLKLIDEALGPEPPCQASRDARAGVLVR